MSSNLGEGGIVKNKLYLIFLSFFVAISKTFLWFILSHFNQMKNEKLKEFTFFFCVQNPPEILPFVIRNLAMIDCNFY